MVNPPFDLVAISVPPFASAQLLSEYFAKLEFQFVVIYCDLIFGDFRGAFHKSERMGSRLLPLHTCGVSFLTIAHSTCSRAQNLHGRLGSITRKIARVAKLLNPLIFVLQYQWLLFLSFIDDRLLTIANIVEKIFPPSKLIFDNIDNLLHLIETFPRKFDDAVDKLPCFNKVLFLEWAVTQAISLLKFTIAILMNWGRDGTREKEILVDMNYGEGRNGSKSECCLEGTMSSVAMNGTHKEVMKMETKGEEDDEKGTYRKSMEDKEELEHEESCKKGEKNEAKMEEPMEKAEGNEVIPDQGYKGEEARVVENGYEEEARNNGSIENQEDILKLFETAWLMKPASIM